MQVDLPYWVALTHFGPFGAVRMARLARRFPDMQRAFEASASQLIESGIEPKITSRFLQERIHINPDALMRELELHGIQALTVQDEVYPSLLKQIYDPPAVLYIRGELPDPERRHIAVVGSRKATSYGLRVTEDLTGDLAREGVVIVSGLAYGVDAAAHDAALQAGGITLAVLGSGIDNQSIYPSQNRALASRIISQGGALISEFPVGTPPLKHHFPFRNRVIAGMCHGTLVTQAALKSGSLITARAALESNRDVYAVPGSIHEPLSEGPNNLIKLGATPTTCSADIIGIEPAKPSQPPYEPANIQERNLIDKLSKTPTHLDELVRALNIPTPKVNSLLSLLEIKNAIRHEGAGYYTRR
ncbi:MAG: DNA-protecting protein DprA [Parcubacteria group bacterium]|nr:DNA-protecting protein DprA [Parcubacteria group bacterium]